MNDFNEPLILDEARKDFLRVVSLRIKVLAAENIEALYPDGSSGKLMQAIFDLRYRFFGLTYEAMATKTLKRDCSSESLAESLICYENVFGRETIINEHINLYEDFKLILEKDAPLFKYEEILASIGIKRDRRRVSLPERNKISVQCAAQVLCFLEGNRFPTIESIKRDLLEKKSPFFVLLNLGRFHDPDTIKNWIREVWPVPEGERKRKIRPAVSGMKKIPGISTSEGINFPKLIVAISYLTLSLKILEWDVERILASIFIEHLPIPSHPFVAPCVHSWVKEAFKRNACILL